jgi:hypothetical protein
MQKSVVKKVRLTEAEAKELARLAKRRKTTESDILREGIRRISTHEGRRKNIDRLIALAEAEDWEWKKVRPEVRW